MRTAVLLTVVSVVLVVSSGVLFWAESVCAEELDYFPLQVGNWWLYECVEPHPEVSPIHGKTCVASDRPTMVAVTNIVSLGPSSGTLQFSSSELPISEEGQKYYVVTGAIVGHIFGVAMTRSPGNAILFRKDPVKNHALLRGYFAENSDLWTIWGEERMLYDLSVFVLGEPKQWQTDRSVMMWMGWGGLLTVGAGSFGAVALHERATFIDRYIWFAPDIGIVSFGDRRPSDGALLGELSAALDLREARINGVRYPRQGNLVEESAWGEVKSATTDRR